MLENITVPKQPPANVRLNFQPGNRTVLFGLVRQRFSGKVELSAFSKKHPEIYQALLELGNTLSPDKTFNSILLHKNVVCPPHKDNNNIGESMLVSLGEYEGCNIVVDGKEYNTNRNPLIFDGSQLEHYNTPLISGTKYSIVYFNRNKS